MIHSIVFFLVMVSVFTFFLLWLHLYLHLRISVSILIRIFENCRLCWMECCTVTCQTAKSPTARLPTEALNRKGLNVILIVNILSFTSFACSHYCYLLFNSIACYLLFNSMLYRHRRPTWSTACVWLGRPSSRESALHVFDTDSDTFAFLTLEFSDEVLLSTDLVETEKRTDQNIVDWISISLY